MSACLPVLRSLQLSYSLLSLTPICSDLLCSALLYLAVRCVALLSLPCFSLPSALLRFGQFHSLSPLQALLCFPHLPSSLLCLFVYLSCLFFSFRLIL